MKFNFDELIDRENTACYKFDWRRDVFGKEDIIPMWVADMDFRTPPFIIEAIRKRLDHEILGYTFRSGTFYDSIVNWMKKRHQWDVKKEWISFSPGIVPALNLAVLAFTNPGDKIVVQKPVYFPFFPSIENHKRIIVNNPLKYVNGRYEMDFDDLDKKTDQGVKMIMLCSPHNPTGNVWSHTDLERLAKICLDKNILILSDEIHSDLIFRGKKHIPTATISPEISDITVTCIAPSKTFNLAGLSTSTIITSNTILKKKYDKMLDDIHVGGGNIFGFTALESAYNNGDEWLSELMHYLQGNMEYLLAYFKKHILLIKPVVPEATYMIWLDCRDLGLSENALRKFMIDEAGLGLSDGMLFGHEGRGFQRINIGCSRGRLIQALIQLKKAIDKRFNQ